MEVRDPIHGSISIDDWAVPIIDNVEFQRLRRIHQLGTANLVYPGANHRRFEHSLGAYHLAGRIARAVGLEEQDALTVKAGALLHDIGHGPFSHAFEELLLGSGQSHEQTSVDLVCWGPIGDLLRKGGLDPTAVADLVVGKGDLAKLVSGPIDADRMDYLLRDAHYTGVRTSVDPDRLMDVLELDSEHGIVLRESGVLSAESLLTMRFLMYPAVYLHHTVRASEAMLQASIMAAVDAGAFTLRDAERDTDDQLMARLRAAGGEATELATRLDRRRLYKRAHEARHEDALHFPEGISHDTAARRAIADQIADAASVPRHHVILDVPKPPKFKEVKLPVRRRDGAVVTLSEASQLVRVMSDARMDHWRTWVFAPKESREAVAHAAPKVLGDLPA